MEVKKHGLLRKDIVLGTALVDMYAKCGSLSKAREVFDELPLHDAIAWNSLIAGYVEDGRGEEALNCLLERGASRRHIFRSYHNALFFESLWYNKVII